MTAGAASARARKLLTDEQFPDAIEAFTQALTTDSRYAMAHNGRGFAYYRLKQYAEAIADFDEAIRIESGVRECISESQRRAQGGGGQTRRGRGSGEVRANLAK